MVGILIANLQGGYVISHHKSKSTYYVTVATLLLSPKRNFLPCSYSNKDATQRRAPGNRYEPFAIGRYERSMESVFVFHPGPERGEVESVVRGETGFERFQTVFVEKIGERNTTSET